MNSTTQTSMPLIFEIATYNEDSNVSLFSEAAKEYQIIKPYTHDSRTKNGYKDFLRFIHDNPIRIGQLRIEFGYNKHSDIIFARNINGKLVTKVIPIRMLMLINQFINNVVYLKVDDLVLDGNATITFSDVNSNPIKLYVYPLVAEEGKQPVTADEAFLNFVNDQYATFYDFIELKNKTLDSQKCSLFFTDKGVKSDNQKVEIRSNELPYAVGDKVHLWKLQSDNDSQKSEPLYVGKDVLDYKSGNHDYHEMGHRNFLFPLTYPNQFITDTIHGVDEEGRTIEDFEVPCYSYMLRAGEKICFTIFKSTEVQVDKRKMLATSEMKSHITVVSSKHDSPLSSIVENKVVSMEEFTSGKLDPALEKMREEAKEVSNKFGGTQTILITVPTKEKHEPTFDGKTASELGLEETTKP